MFLLRISACRYSRVLAHPARIYLRHHPGWICRAPPPNQLRPSLQVRRLVPVNMEPRQVFCPVPSSPVHLVGALFVIYHYYYDYFVIIIIIVAFGCMQEYFPSRTFIQVILLCHSSLRDDALPFGCPACVLLCCYAALPPSRGEAARMPHATLLLSVALPARRRRA